MEELKSDLLNHLSLNNIAFIKYQQRDEEELNINQRRVIAENLLRRSITMFLNRFGSFLNLKHFEYFDQLSFDDKDKDEMIKKQVKNLKWNLDHKQQVVKNRRYACMRKMIKEKNIYFSEDEMIERDPELYEDIVGQYLSTVEKQARKKFDVKKCSLVEILYESIDQQDEKLRENEATNSINDESEGQQLMNEDSNSQEAHENLWGNFDGERKTAKKRKSHFITKGEQDMLKKEWTDIMYNNFLSGKDIDYFDYTEVDGNDMYDETCENDQDCQDKYFDEEDEASIKSAENCNESESDEDDLDVYMKHIESHINQQNHDVFKEEFDD